MIDIRRLSISSSRSNSVETKTDEVTNATTTTTTTTVTTSSSTTTATVLKTQKQVSRKNLLAKPSKSDLLDWHVHLPNREVESANTKKQEDQEQDQVAAEQTQQEQEETQETLKLKEPNTYNEPSSDEFYVRGKGYLEGTTVVDRSKKVPADKPLYSIAGINVFKAKKDLFHIASKVESLKQYLASENNKDREQNKNLPPKFLVMCWNFRSAWGAREHTCVVHLFKRNDDQFDHQVNAASVGFQRALDEFVHGNHDQKSERLKFMFKIRESAAVVRKTISGLGGEKPVLIAKKLKTRFFSGENYLEINQDVGSSMIAAMLNSTMLKASKDMIVDTSWLIQAQEESELPERLLGIVRWNFVNIKDVAVQLDSDFEPIGVAEE